MHLGSLVTTLRGQPNVTTSSADYKMLAAVDMGTNSFHMVIVRADSKGRFQIVDVVCRKNEHGIPS
jgi:hypothetical protein